MTAVAENFSDKQELWRNEPMARHTSWRVGGPADIYFRPHSIASLQNFLAGLPSGTPVTWIGLGSNLLVRDGGIRGAVIATGALPKTFDAGESGVVRCSAALPCASLARQCARASLGPAAFFAGIPGSVGGALAMNAGAFGGETWDRITTLTTIDAAGQLRERPRSDYRVAYRRVEGPAGEWFVGACFGLSKLPETETESIRALLRERADKQPLGLPSAGSVFRNPADGHAGALIERAGLKGLTIGGAVVAEKHANFIINTGTATAADIESLISEVRRRVEAASGVVLEPEVRVLGEAGR